MIVRRLPRRFAPDRVRARRPARRAAARSTTSATPGPRARAQRRWRGERSARVLRRAATRERRRPIAFADARRRPRGARRFDSRARDPRPWRARAGIDSRCTRRATSRRAATRRRRSTSSSASSERRRLAARLFSRHGAGDFASCCAERRRSSRSAAHPVFFPWTGVHRCVSSGSEDQASRCDFKRQPTVE